MTTTTANLSQSRRLVICGLVSITSILLVWPASAETPTSRAATLAEVQAHHYPRLVGPGRWSRDYPYSPYPSTAPQFWTPNPYHLGFTLMEKGSRIKRKLEGSTTSVRKMHKRYERLARTYDRAAQHFAAAYNGDPNRRVAAVSMDRARQLAREASMRARDLELRLAGDVSP